MLHNCKGSYSRKKYLRRGPTVVRYLLKYPLKYLSYLAILPVTRKNFRSKLYDAFLYTKSEKVEILREKQKVKGSRVV